MRNFWTKLNYFTRGEVFLHIVTMFTILTIVMQVGILAGIFFPTWSLIVFTIATAILWEVVGKIIEQKPINFGDIIGGLLGGFLTILIFRIL